MSEIQRIKEPEEYPVSAQPEPQGALTTALVQREVAGVQSAMLIAQKCPRDQAKARERILIACQRPGLAEGAVYTYARGGTNITGPSIRLAEAIALEWGNLDFGTHELDQHTGESTMQAYAWDLERNVRQIRSWKVRHIRHTRERTYNLEDPRDIYEAVANQGARRLRACILGLIPGDIIEDAVAQCEKTLKVRADTSPEGLKKMVEAFAKFGVAKEQIEARLQRKLEAITPAQVVQFQSIYNSLKDGMSGPGDWFEPVASEDEATEQGVKGTARAKQALRKQATAPKPVAAPTEAQDGPWDEENLPQDDVPPPDNGTPAAIPGSGSVSD